MVQVFLVVTCFSCNVFQVQQKKKTNKWDCKMCGEKQSFRKIYFEGSGAECRSIVQQRNLLRGQLDSSNAFTSIEEREWERVGERGQHEGLEGGWDDEEQRGNSSSNSFGQNWQKNQERGSKWSKFVEDIPEEESNPFPKVHSTPLSEDGHSFTQPLTSKHKPSGENKNRPVAPRKSEANHVQLNYYQGEEILDLWDDSNNSLDEFADRGTMRSRKIKALPPSSTSFEERSPPVTVSRRQETERLKPSFLQQSISYPNYPPESFEPAPKSFLRNSFDVKNNKNNNNNNNNNMNNINNINNNNLNNMNNNSPSNQHNSNNFSLDTSIPSFLLQSVKPSSTLFASPNPPTSTEKAKNEHLFSSPQFNTPLSSRPVSSLLNQTLSSEENDAPLSEYRHQGNELIVPRSSLLGGPPFKLDDSFPQKGVHEVHSAPRHLGLKTKATPSQTTSSNSKWAKFLDDEADSDPDD